MTIQKALNRLTWRLSTPEGEKSPRTFKPNDDDITALNRVIEHINDSREAALGSNRGFAKLYTMVYLWQLEKHKATPPEDLVQRELHKMLDRPLDYFFDKATRILNEIEIEIFRSEYGLDDGKHPALLSDAEREERNNKLTKALADKPENNDRFLGKVWNRDEVEMNLESVIAEALIKFKL